VSLQPHLDLLDPALLTRILDEAFELLRDPGIKLTAPEAIELLTSSGASFADGIARIPRHLAERALAAAPREFSLYARDGTPAVRYAGGVVHFDPGSSCLNILDPETLQPRPALCADLLRLVQVAEMLPQYAAQSTALVCAGIPEGIADLYRLFLVLCWSDKPVVTGAFSAVGLAPMLDLLAAEAGGRDALRAKPRAVFDVCPSPPLNWSDFAAENIVELARAGVPAQIVPVPLAGIAAPVTLAGAAVQHAAEALAGVALHQLASPGAPVVWGGAPAIVDMRSGATPWGAIESVMLNMACAQCGKHLGLPTHAYLATSDSKLMDAQAGMESGVSAVLGALAGINMISGAGMLDSLACHSVEKLALDAEAIASAQRLLAGIEARTTPLATAMFAAAGPKGEFLQLPETRKLFRAEQHLPSDIIQRDSSAPSTDTFSRARQRVAELLASYQPSSLCLASRDRLRAAVSPHAQRAGLATLPGV
jgi:trimethylamine--corrinoid protein Co-methyltransferase